MAYLFGPCPFLIPGLLSPQGSDGGELPSRGEAPALPSFRLQSAAFPTQLALVPFEAFRIRDPPRILHDPDQSPDRALEGFSIPGFKKQEVDPRLETPHHDLVARVSRQDDPADQGPAVSDLRQEL